MKPIFIFISVFLFLSELGAQNCPSGDEVPSAVNMEFEAEVLRLTNLERQKSGLKPLRWNEHLAYAARYHAKEMGEYNFFNHDSYRRDKNGKLILSCSTFDRMRKFISFSYMAENISAGWRSPEKVVEGWMHSAGHRKNILNKNMTELGVGFYYHAQADYQYYWVQNFGGK